MSQRNERAYWERNASRYDRSMGLLGGPLPRMIELAGQAVQGTGRVLEVAAGTGLVTPALAAAARHVEATDYAEAMVAQLRARVDGQGLANVICRRADIYDLPFAEDEFDAVVAANVLHLVPDLEAALVQTRRVLKPGGVLIAPTFCHDQTALSRIMSRVLAVTAFPGHRRFSTESLVASLAKGGLEVARVETIPGLIPIGYVEGRFR